MPEKRKFSFHSERSGTALSVRVLPNAHKSEITGIRPDGCIIIRLASDSVDEKCHPTLLKFLAETLSIDAAKIEVVAGENGDYKIVSIVGVETKKVDDVLRSTKKISG